jgi:hypothetical protein
MIAKSRYFLMFACLVFTISSCKKEQDTALYPSTPANPQNAVSPSTLFNPIKPTGPTVPTGIYGPTGPANSRTDSVLGVFAGNLKSFQNTPPISFIEKPSTITLQKTDVDELKMTSPDISFYTSYKYEPSQSTDTKWWFRGIEYNPDVPFNNKTYWLSYNPLTKAITFFEHFYVAHSYYEEWNFTGTKQ